MYDASDRESFLKLQKMIETVLLIEKSEKRGAKTINFNTRKVIIGNKCDMKVSKHILTKEDKDLVKDFGRFDISAMTNQGIREVFNNLMQSLTNDIFIRKEILD